MRTPHPGKPTREKPLGRARAGFTLIELLVVIAIIGVLVALLVAGVQTAREVANRVRCANNLAQIGNAWHNCASNKKMFPSGGWGYAWVGYPDRPADKTQPGGWIFNLLPFLEEQNVYNMGTNLSTGALLPSAPADIANRLKTPLTSSIFNCPSRRNGGPYTSTVGAYRETGSTTVSTVMRGDYAACAGSQATNDLGAGPADLATGDGASYVWPDTSGCTGVCFMRSELKFSDLTLKGFGGTYLAGEKSIDPSTLFSGTGNGDKYSMYSGYGADNYRVTAALPNRDKPGSANPTLFGSSHANGCHFLYGDGSVRMVTYNSDLTVHQKAGNRAP